MKFISCGETLPPDLLYTESGGLVTSIITGADPAISGGVNQVVNMTTESGDYISSGLGADGTFMIVIESAAAIKIQLGNGDDFIISAAQATANLGKLFPAKIKKVYKTGTTGTFSTVR